MKFYITCTKCKAHISKDMSYNIREGICPNCGPGLDISDALGVLEFCEISQTLSPKLNKEQLLTIIDKYFKTVLDLKNIPEIFIEEEQSDIIASTPDPNYDSDILENNIKENNTYDTSEAVNTTARTSRSRVKLTPAELEELKNAPDETVAPITSLNTTFGKRDRSNDDSAIQFRSKDELTLHKIGRGTTIPVDAESFSLPEDNKTAPTQSNVQFKYEEVAPDIEFNRSVTLPKVDAPNSKILIPPTSTNIRDILGGN